MDSNDFLFAQLLLDRASHSMLCIRQKELAHHNLTHKEEQIIFIINSLGRKTTLSEVAKYRGRKLNTISCLMAKMDNKGLVKGTRDVPNSTLIHFELTKKGMQVFKKCNGIKVSQELVSVLSDDEWKQFISTLGKITNMSQKESADFTFNFE